MQDSLTFSLASSCFAGKTKSPARIGVPFRLTVEGITQKLAILATLPAAHQSGCTTSPPARVTIFLKIS